MQNDFGWLDEILNSNFHAHNYSIHFFKRNFLHYFFFFPLSGQTTQCPISIVGVNLLRDKTNQDCREDSMPLVNLSQGGQMTN